MGDDNVVVKFTEGETTISTGKDSINLSREQAADLRRILHLTEDILTSCEAYCGEIVGAPR